MKKLSIKFLKYSSLIRDSLFFFGIFFCSIMAISYLIANQTTVISIGLIFLFIALVFLLLFDLILTKEKLEKTEKELKSLQ